MLKVGGIVHCHVYTFWQFGDPKTGFVDLCQQMTSRLSSAIWWVKIASPYLNNFIYFSYIDPGFFRMRYRPCVLNQCAQFRLLMNLEIVMLLLISILVLWTVLTFILWHTANLPVVEALDYMSENLWTESLYRIFWRVCKYPVSIRWMPDSVVVNICDARCKMYAGSALEYNNNEG